jgi:O-antigen/teichoic acid export membrane protein
VKQLRLTIIKNATANVVRGGASAVVALVLPHFLTRSLDVNRYAAWVLILQIAAFANYLDFGLQTAVARFVAQAIERRDNAKRDAIVSTAFRLLAGAGVLAILVASVVTWKIRAIFHGTPPDLVGELRGGVLLLSASAAILLPLSTFTGVLIGLHRNEYPAIAIGGSRLIGAAGVLILLRSTHSLVWLAAAIAVCNVCGGVLQYLICQRLLPGLTIRASAASGKMTRELLHYCAGLTVFAVGMLLISGLDVTIVGYFAFAAAGYYGVAATVVGFLTGAATSVYAALMAPMAVLQARGEQDRIRDLILKISRLGNLASLLLIVLVLWAGKPLLGVWVGSTYAARAFPILEILACAQAFRMAIGPYSIALIATGQQNYGISGALAEGVCNLLFSVILAIVMGPAGVAWGTAIGAIFGVLWAVFYTMKRAKEIRISRGRFGAETMLRPIVCFGPLLLYLGLQTRFHLSGISLSVALILSVVFLLWIGRIPFRFPRLIRSPQ